MEKDKKLVTSRFNLLFIFLISLSLNLYVHFGELFSSFVVFKDMSNLYILDRLRDNTLFRNDLWGEWLMDGIIYTAPGFYLVSSFLVKLMPVEYSFKISSIILNLAAVYLLFRIGKRLKGERLGAMVGIFFCILSLSMDTFFGGGARMYGFVLFCLFLCLLINKKIFFASLAAAASLFFYPYVFPYTALSCYLYIVFSKDYLRKEKIKKTIIITALFSACAAFLCQGLLIITEKYGGFLTYSEIRNLSEAGKEGSYPYNIMNSNYILNNIFNIYEHNEIYARLLLFLAIGIIFLFFYSKTSGLRMIKDLLVPFVSSVITFIIFSAVYILFGYNFGIPSRQLIFSMPVFLVILFSVNLYLFCEKFRINVLPVIIAAAIVFTLGFESNTENLMKYGGMFDFFKKTDNNSLIAGHPLGTEHIPLFSKRKVFIMPRVARPFNCLFWGESKKRLFHLFDAYYSDSLDSARALCSEYHIDYFVIDKEYYRNDYLNEKRLYFEPFDSSIKEKSQKRDFALLKFAENNHEFNFGDVFVISCKKLNKEER